MTVGDRARQLLHERVAEQRFPALNAAELSHLAFDESMGLVGASRSPAATAAGAA